MKTIALQSGSNGNCLYVETAGARLLFDAGLSGRRARGRLAARGRAMEAVDAVIISHDHADHVGCAGVYHRMFGLPLHMSEPTLEACRGRLGRVEGVRSFRPGRPLRLGDAVVHTLPTPHDGAGGAAFVVESGGLRLGILTDLGHPFEELRAVIPTLDGVFIESNYDPEMLRTGPYPAFLKRRIRGPAGHISNHEASELLAEGASGRLQWACLAHLSGKNNAPALALRTHRERWAAGMPLHVAGRHGPTPLLELRSG